MNLENEHDTDFDATLFDRVLLIGGEWVSATSGETRDLVDPATGTVSTLR